jgi:hypothetical protein
MYRSQPFSSKSWHQKHQLLILLITILYGVLSGCGIYVLNLFPARGDPIFGRRPSRSCYIDYLIRCFLVYLDISNWALKFTLIPLSLCCCVL